MGLIFMIIPLVIDNYEVFSFFGLILIIIGLFFTVFTLKQCLTINNDQVKFESKCIIKDFEESIIIPFDNIREVYFFKRQFLILGGRSPIADADAQTLYNENRIVFILGDKESKTIMQTGKLEDFKKAYSIIKSRVEKKEN